MDREEERTQAGVETSPVSRRLVAYRFYELHFFSLDGLEPRKSTVVIRKPHYEAKRRDDIFLCGLAEQRFVSCCTRKTGESSLRVWDVGNGLDDEPSNRLYNPTFSRPIQKLCSDGQLLLCGCDGGGVEILRHNSDDNFQPISQVGSIAPISKKRFDVILHDLTILTGTNEFVTTTTSHTMSNTRFPIDMVHQDVLKIYDLEKLCVSRDVVCTSPNTDSVGNVIQGMHHNPLLNLLFLTNTDSHISIVDLREGKVMGSPFHRYSNPNGNLLSSQCVWFDGDSYCLYGSDYGGHVYCFDVRKNGSEAIMNFRVHEGATNMFSSIKMKGMRERVSGERVSRMEVFVDHANRKRLISCSGVEYGEGNVCLVNLNLNVQKIERRKKMFERRLGVRPNTDFCLLGNDVVSFLHSGGFEKMDFEERVEVLRKWSGKILGFTLVRCGLMNREINVFRSLLYV